MSDSVLQTRAQVARLVTLKLEGLKMVRALDRVGPDPRRTQGLAPWMADFAAIDMSLTAAIYAMESGEGLGVPVEPMIEGAQEGLEELRRALGNVLKPGDARAFERAIDGAVATEDEVWAEVREFSDVAPMADPWANPPGGSGGDLDDALEELAAAVLSGEVDATPDLDARTLKRDASRLPRSPAPEAWLRQLPKSWLDHMLSVSELTQAGKKGLAAERMAQHLLDPASLERVIAKRFGSAELEFLAHLVVDGLVDEWDMPGLIELMNVPWEPGRKILANPFARVRVTGLAFVGRIGGEHHVGLPEQARVPIATALLGVLSQRDDEEAHELVEMLEEWLAEEA
jgi:hypothetical protein